VIARRRLAAILAGAVAVSAGSCGGGRELEPESVHAMLRQPGTIPPTPPSGLMPASNEALAAACPYLMPGPEGRPVIKPQACKYLRVFDDGGRIALREVTPRRVLSVTNVAKPADDVRVARFRFEWATDAIDETVRSCFAWAQGYAQVRFARVEGKWQMNGFEEDADTSPEEPCPAEPR
jgi:hypothetical protein